MDDFYSKFKPEQTGFEEGYKPPKIIYVANKAEDGYEGDIWSDFYLKFPNSTEHEPIFISAEHGDGFTDLYAEIQKHIPLEAVNVFEQRKEKRVQRFLELKEQLMDDLIDHRMKVKPKKDDGSTSSSDALEEFVREWDKDFDRVNANPELNSDFDSDNDINPLDSISQDGKYTSSGQQIQSENAMKRKPIQLSIVGKPNIGKSTLVNSLLKDHRVVANDMAGTTRDSIQVQWVYQGRRVVLVDTAGIKPGTGLPKDQVEILVNEQV